MKKIRVEAKYKNFIELLDFSHGKYNTANVFRDFILIFAIAIHNGFYYRQEYEDIYLQVINKYQKEEHQIFFKLIEELINIYFSEREIKDILGEIYTQIGAYSKTNQQFFTPNHVANAMANMTVQNEGYFKNKQYITINDPACGSGVLLINIADVLNKQKINYTEKALFVGQDIDFVCVCMTYIQMYMFNMPGIVIQGNSLLDERNKVLYTPQYIVGEWYKKDLNEKRRNNNDKERAS